VEKREETVVAEGAQSREFKYAEVFEGLPQGVRAEALFRDLNLSEKLRRGSAFEVFKGR
jgi:hypothetical protein